MEELPFTLLIGVGEGVPTYLASFADYRVARIAAVRRLSMLDLARKEQACTAMIAFEGSEVFEAHRDGKRVVIDSELLDPRPAGLEVQVPSSR